MRPQVILNPGHCRTATPRMLVCDENPQKTNRTDSFIWVRGVRMYLQHVHHSLGWINQVHLGFGLSASDQVPHKSVLVWVACHGILHRSQFVWHIGKYSPHFHNNIHYMISYNRNKSYHNGVVLFQNWRTSSDRQAYVHPLTRDSLWTFILCF